MRFTWFTNKIERIKNKFKPHSFMIGDRIKYPHHGAGRIMALETYKGRDFYKIQMEAVNMKILVPIEKMTKVGAVYIKPRT